MQSNCSSRVVVVSSNLILTSALTAIVASKNLYLTIKILKVIFFISFNVYGIGRKLDDTYDDTTLTFSNKASYLCYILIRSIALQGDIKQICLYLQLNTNIYLGR